jgi:mitochondrial Rho GTPase 1
MREEVRVLVCGEQGVGKTSLVNALVHGRVIETEEDVLPLTLIPREESEDNVATLLWDSGAGEEHKLKLLQLLSQADAILLLYADDRPATLDRLGSVWLPLLTHHTKVHPAQSVPLAELLLVLLVLRGGLGIGMMFNLP